MKKTNFLLALTAMATLSGTANASTIPYPNSGTVNPNTYTFSATGTGLLTAYFAGSSASYTETVTILDATTSASVTGLNDHTSNIGDTISLAVNAGDTIVFKDNVANTGDVFSNISANNVDGGNHVYSTAYNGSGISGISVIGTYVAFEDLRFPGSDYNYHDDTFVFTNTSTVTTPIPAAIWMVGSALAGLVGFGRRKLLA